MRIRHQSGPSTRLSDLLLTEHTFQVPLDHGFGERAGGGESLLLFAREVVAPGRASDDLPWLLFLQGGPGFGAPRPSSRAGWLDRALEDHRVLLLDERGTGRSSPVSAQSLAGLSPDEQAARLSCYRADSIVADCELVRRTLLGRDARWKVLGQSFGGFCATRYLSVAPEGLSAALITGGLPPLSATPEAIYRRTYPLVEERNRKYYARYPGDVEPVRAVVARLERGDVVLPTGGPLSKRRLQQLGLLLGFSDGAETIHALFEDAWVPGREGEELAYTFLRGFEGALHFDTNPLFTVLHEACYTQGVASGWAAERVRREFPAFDAADGPLQFTGEMVYPWMLEEFPTLAPLREAADLLAQRHDWPLLYDRQALARNEVPVAAAVYHDDMYVEREFSLETAAAIRGAEVWITNEYEHNGLRADGKAILDRLLARTR